VSYIGNNLQVAYPSYRNIDDISGSFDGVTTSFPLTVGGAAPVPAPLSSNQCLISVGGVVQRPDDSGTEGFLLSGGNIVFSAAPTGGDDFFGVILAGADYVNVGVNFPSGTATTPSITFDTDLDTGIYNSAANELSFTTAGVNKLTLNSSGDVVITDKISHLGDTNTAIRFPAADTVSVETNGNERARIDSSGRLLIGTSTSRAVSGVNSNIQLEGTTYDSSCLSLVRNSASDVLDAGGLLFGRSRGSGTTVVASNDRLGFIGFFGANGSDLSNPAALIEGFSDGTPGVGDMPGRLVFSTTADGASSPTERIRIAQNGQTEYRNCPFVGPITDNTTLLGGAGFRWSQVWAANGTIQTSDQRTKTEIANATLGADFVKALRPVSYKWIEGGKQDTGERDEDGNYIYKSVPGERTHWGFIAQEVKEAVDTAGVDFGGWVLTDKDDPDSQQALRYDQFIAPLTKALQETMAELEALKAKVAALEAS